MASISRYKDVSLLLGKTYMSSFLFNIGLILMCAMPVVQFSAQAFSDYARNSTINQIFNVQIANLNFFGFFFTNNKSKQTPFMSTNMALRDVAPRPKRHLLHTERPSIQIVFLLHRHRCCARRASCGHNFDPPSPKLGCTESRSLPSHDALVCAYTHTPHTPGSPVQNIHTNMNLK